jgi:hypothetical protein
VCLLAVALPLQIPHCSSLQTSKPPSAAAPPKRAPVAQRRSAQHYAGGRALRPRRVATGVRRVHDDPGSHNDTYAESFHRDFFAKYAWGVPPEHCAEGTEGHNTAQIGAFVVRDFLACAMTID